MSLEQSIAALTAQAGLLLDLPQNIANTATAQINAIGAAYQARLNSMSTQFFVDQTNGLDTNAGTQAAPFKTIDKALAQTPFGGFCAAVLVSDYIFTTDLVVNGRILQLTSSSVVRRNLFFTRATIDNGLYRAISAFYLLGKAHVSIVGLKINVPVLDGPWPAIAASRDGIFTTPSVVNWEPVSVTIASCDIDIPAAPFCRLFAGLILLDLTVYSVSLTGAVTSLLGRLSEDQINTAGVASSTLPWLQTNLTSI